MAQKQLRCSDDIVRLCQKLAVERWEKTGVMVEWSDIAREILTTVLTRHRSRAENAKAAPPAAPPETTAPDQTK
jgi:hypothetical protein